MEETNKNKEKIFPHDFIFVFTPYIIGAILPKNVEKSGEFRKNSLMAQSLLTLFCE